LIFFCFRTLLIACLAVLLVVSAILLLVLRLFLRQFLVTAQQHSNDLPFVVALILVVVITLYPLCFLGAQRTGEVVEVFLNTETRKRKLIEKYNKLMTKLQSKDPSQKLEPPVDPSE
jgi:hypothetical protein